MSIAFSGFGKFARTLNPVQNDAPPSRSFKTAYPQNLWTAGLYLGAGVLFCAVKAGITPNSCGKNHTPPKRGVDNAVEKWITGVTEELQNASSCKDRAVAPLSLLRRRDSLNCHPERSEGSYNTDFYNCRANSRKSVL